MIKLNNLLYEIFKDKETIKHCFYSSFKNDNDEKEFFSFKMEYYKRLRFYIGILICSFILISILLSNVFVYEFKLYDVIIKGIILILNITCLFIILKTYGHSSINICLCYIKFFANVLTYIYILIYFLNLNIVQNVILDKVNVIRLYILAYHLL